jgi:hypothetical protein
MLTTLVAGRLGVRIPTNNSRVLSPPASYMGLACQDGYIALRCKNFELYDNLRKISSNLFHPEYLLLINQAIQEQAAIGWPHMIKGFLAKTWHMLASTYPSNSMNPPIIQDDGHSGIQKSLKALWTMLLEI